MFANDSLSLGGTHDKRFDVFLECAFLQQLRKRMRCPDKAFVVSARADDEPAWVQVIVQARISKS